MLGSRSKLPPALMLRSRPMLPSSRQRLVKLGSRSELLDQRKARLMPGSRSELAFARVGVELEWRGSGVDEVGADGATGATRVRVDPRYFRPAEVDRLLADSGKARRELGWEPTVTFEELAAMMVDADVQMLGGNR
mgnify:CR=1 FL=1